MGQQAHAHSLLVAARKAASAFLKPQRPVSVGCATPLEAASLNELARDCGLGVVLSEDKIPIRDTVRGACELLGLDPLHIANEGQFLAVVAAEHADVALEALKGTPGGHEAVSIGQMCEQPAGAVLGATSYGGTRVIDMLVRDPLPRIC